MSEWNNPYTGFPTLGNSGGPIHPRWTDSQGNATNIPDNLSVQYDDLYPGSSTNSRLLALAHAIVPQARLIDFDLTICGVLDEYYGALIVPTGSSSFTYDFSATAAYFFSLPTISTPNDGTYYTNAGTEPVLWRLGPGTNAFNVGMVTDIGNCDGVHDESKSVSRTGLAFDYSSVGQGELIGFRATAQVGELDVRKYSCGFGGGQGTFDKEERKFWLFKSAGNAPIWCNGQQYSNGAEIPDCSNSLGSDEEFQIFERQVDGTWGDRGGPYWYYFPDHGYAYLIVTASGKVGYFSIGSVNPKVSGSVNGPSTEQLGSDVTGLQRTATGHDVSADVVEAYPNPFNPSTKISFTLKHDAQVSLTVFNALGQMVRVLLNESLSAGAHSAVFEAGDLPSGVYMYRLEAGSLSTSKTIILMK